MSRLPGERAPVSAPSGATLLVFGGARCARPRVLEASPGQRQVCVGVQAFANSAWRVTCRSSSLS